MSRKVITILSGAGISRESGLQTFRDMDGLWEGYNVEEVCTPRALKNNPEMVLDFYNLRRKAVAEAQPNSAHFALADLEQFHEVRIITQNIDDLHERAGSTKILHLHGEIFVARSIEDSDLRQEIRGDIKVGDLASDGAQLRPHICFFQETPFNWDTARQWVTECNEFVVIGTSLNVYPAAGLVDIARNKPITIIDPNPPALNGVSTIALPATEGVPLYIKKLLELG